jgi:hypothetical protein
MSNPGDADSNSDAASAQLPRLRQVDAELDHQPAQFRGGKHDQR